MEPSSPVDSPKGSLGGSRGALQYILPQSGCVASGFGQVDVLGAHGKAGPLSSPKSSLRGPQSCSRSVRQSDGFYSLSPRGGAGVQLPRVRKLASPQGTTHCLLRQAEVSLGLFQARALSDHCPLGT